MGTRSAYRLATLVLMLACLWLWLAAWATAPRDQVRVVVESGYFVIAPAWIRLRVIIEPDAANRSLTVSATSTDFARSSAEPLEGARSPRTRWIEWRDIPAGIYTVRAVVTRESASPWYASAGFTVVER